MYRFHLLLGAVICSKLINSSGVCPPQWKSFENKCYYFTKAKGHFDDNYQLCKTMDANMVTIKSHEENRFVSGLVGYEHYWLGIKRVRNNEYGSSRNRVPLRGVRKVVVGGNAFSENERPKNNGLMDSIREWLNGNRGNKSATTNNGNDKNEYTNWEIGYPSRLKNGNPERCAYLNGFTGRWMDTQCSQRKHVMCQLTLEDEVKRLVDHMDGKIKNLSSKFETIQNQMDSLITAVYAVQADHEKQIMTRINKMKDNILGHVSSSNHNIDAKMKEITDDQEEKMKFLQEYLINYMESKLQGNSEVEVEDIKNRSKMLEEKLINLKMNTSQEMQEIKEGVQMLALETEMVHNSSSEMSQNIAFLKSKFEDSNKYFEDKINDNDNKMKAEMDNMTSFMDKNMQNAIDIVNEKVKDKNKEIDQTMKAVQTMRSEMSQVSMQDMEMKSDITSLRNEVNTTTEKFDNFSSAFSMIHKSFIETINNLGKQIEKINLEMNSMKQSLSSQALEMKQINSKIKTVDEEIDNRIRKIMETMKGSP